VYRMKNLLYVFLLLFNLNSGVASASPVKPRPVLSNTSATFNDSSIILIPFDYKQSALFHAYTFEVMDSVVNLLLKDSSITLSINGYAHQDEGSDTICKYLSLNRALFVRDYILGRGVQPFRIIFVRGMGKKRSQKTDVNKDGHVLNCRAELVLSYPTPPPPPELADRDGDGVADADEFGYKENKGCPDKDAVIIPFDFQESKLNYNTYQALDSVIMILKQNQSFSIEIQGHAYSTEGIRTVCERLAGERAEIVKNYLLSRYIGINRITAINNFGSSRPFNAGRNPLEVTKNARVQLLFKK